MNVVSTDTSTGLCLADLLYQIMFEIGQIVGGNVAYTKFPRKFIIQKLNNRLNLFVLNSQCIRKTAIIQCKAGYKQYKLPSNCMDGGIIGAPKYFLTADNYQTLYMRDTQWLDDQYDGWRTDVPSTPLYTYMGNSYGNSGLLGVYPAPATDGLDYTIAPDVGIVTGNEIPGTNNDIFGSATGGSATTLVDTTVDFTQLGLTVGMTVLNVPDGSQCVIQQITVNTLTVSALTGGAANVWAAGNSYNILAGEYGVVTSWAGDDIYLFSSQVGLIDTIKIPQGNILVDFIPYPIPFPYTGNDNQFPEIPKLYHMGLAMGVVADLLSTFNEKTKEFNRAQSYDKQFWTAVQLAQRIKKSRPFDNKPVMIAPRRRGFRNK
jgi:hypothetical protein